MSPNYLIIAVLCIAAAQASLLLPEQKAWDRCDSIGSSSGCSGCSNALTGCEWCAVNVDETYLDEEHSNCAPKGYCANLSYNGDPTNMFVEAVYEPANHLCPADPIKTEPVFKGSRVTIPAETKHTGFFESKYCEFPEQPWAIDRTVNYYFDDPTQFCHDFNFHQRYGGRQSVEYNCDIDLDVPRNQECLKLYQSFACTIGCPEYGVPAEFDNICYEDAKRLWDVCDDDSGDYDTFYDCLSDYGYFPYDYADEGEEDCYHLTAQNLIPASSEFAHDYCFFGDPERCNDVRDCQVQLNPVYGYWGDHCDCCVSPGFVIYNPKWPNNTAYLTKIHAENATAPNGGIICLYPGYFSFTLAVFTIEALPYNGGHDCIDSVLYYTASNFGIYWIVALECDYDNLRCKIVSGNSGDYHHGTPMTACDSPADVFGFSDEAQCWLDWIDYID